MRCSNVVLCALNESELWNSSFLRILEMIGRVEIGLLLD